MANYRVFDNSGTIVPLQADEVEQVMDWDDDDASLLGGEMRFTHMQRQNTRTGEWKTVIAWDPKFAVYADESANVRL